MKYIENDRKNGIEYDFNLIFKEYEKIGIPDIYFKVLKENFEEFAWIIELSERATGKTTAFLLLGLVMFKLYGTVTVYCRQTSEMVAPKFSSTLFDVVLDNKYIEKIFDGEYNSVFYKSKKWFLAKVDTDGKIVEISETHFCRMLSLDDDINIKSSVNETIGDLFIYDEFIRIDNRNFDNEFALLSDVISTVFRLRISGKIIMLANTIDKNSFYFHDLKIHDYIDSMEFGDAEKIEVDGVKMFVEIIQNGKKFKEHKKKWTEKFFNFGRSELSAITGAAEWSIKAYPHIPHFLQNEPYEKETICKIVYINKIISVDIFNSEKYGIFMAFCPCKKIYKNDIILTDENDKIPNSLHGFGDGTNISKLIQHFYKIHKVYFSANDMGALLDKYQIKCYNRLIY